MKNQVEIKTSETEIKKSENQDKNTFLKNGLVPKKVMHLRKW